MLSRNLTSAYVMILSAFSGSVDWVLLSIQYQTLV